MLYPRTPGASARDCIPSFAGLRAPALSNIRAVKPALRVGISVLLTVLFIYLFARKFDVRAAVAAFREASFGLILLSVALTIAAYVVRAWRWRVLMEPVKPRVGMYNLTSTMFIGFMISFIVPFRVGEVARPVLLARREKVSTTSCLATVALERLFDIITVMTLLAVFVLTTSRGSSLMSSAGEGTERQASVYLYKAIEATAVLVALALPLVLWLVLFPESVLRLLRRLFGGHGPTGDRLVATVENLIFGLGILKRKRQLIEAVALSFLMWLVIDGSVYAGIRAFALPLGFSDMFLLIVPLGLGIVMPTPGGVGPYEYLCQISLSGFWGVPEAVAGATAVTLHAVTLVPTILLGLFFMWQGGVRPAEVRDMARIPG